MPYLIQGLLLLLYLGLVWRMRRDWQQRKDSAFAVYMGSFSLKIKIELMLIFLFLGLVLSGQWRWIYLNVYTVVFLYALYLLLKPVLELSEGCLYMAKGIFGAKSSCALEELASISIEGKQGGFKRLVLHQKLGQSIERGIGLPDGAFLLNLEAFSKANGIPLKSLKRALKPEDLK